MKLDDLISQENESSSGPLDAVALKALSALGFISVSYRLHQFLGYHAYITGTRKDGTSMTWSGSGLTPEDAEANAIKELYKWITKQQIPYYTMPSGVIP